MTEERELMQMVRIRKVICCAMATAATIVLTSTARADVQNFTDAQRPLWFDAVASLGDYTTITFSDLSAGTIVTNQYQQDFGIAFTDGNDRIHFCPICYPNDDFGIDGNLTTTIVFDEAQNWFATDNPGILQIRLYRDGELFHTGPPSAFFAGVISDVSFDKVVVFDPGDSNVNMDDIYFGTIPAPIALIVVMGFMVLRQNGRRRTARHWHLALIAIVAGAATTSARADVQNFTDAQRPLWFDGVGQLGSYSTIDFTGFPNATVITDQYQLEFGVVLAEGDERVRFNPAVYLNDDWGLDGNLTTTIDFDTPQNWFATDTPGFLQIRLYRDGELFHTGPGAIYFAGVISEEPFDRVVVFDPGDSNVDMDDIYFGTVPAPPALVLLSGWFAVQNRSGRRRRSS